MHSTSLGQRSQVPDEFKDQLTTACKHLLSKMGEHWADQ